MNKCLILITALFFISLAALAESDEAVYSGNEEAAYTELEEAVNAEREEAVSAETEEAVSAESEDAVKTKSEDCASFKMREAKARERLLSSSKKMYRCAKSHDSNDRKCSRKINDLRKVQRLFAREVTGVLKSCA